MTEQTQEQRREERKKQRLAEKEAAKGTPIPPKPPVAYVRIDVTTFIPRNPNDPDAGGDQGKTDPLMFEIHENKRLDMLPPNMSSYLRDLMIGVVKHARTYKPVEIAAEKNVPVAGQAAPMAVPTPANDDVLITGAAPDAPAGAQRPTFTVPDGPTEVEQGICQRCGWREMECGCEEGYLPPEAA